MMPNVCANVKSLNLILNGEFDAKQLLNICTSNCTKKDEVGFV